MELEGRKILVTGAAGFIGSHLCERLAPGNTLLAVDDFSVGRRENLGSLERRPDAEIVEADVTDLDAVHSLCRDVEVVFHLAISCLRTSLAHPEMSHDINAGGTLSVCRAAHEQGKRIHVWVDETRPRLQGARLTAWELMRYGIPMTLIADNAAGHLMLTGQVDLVLVGADRVAANGDVANKIGTYKLAVLAKENGIPCYSVCPTSTPCRHDFGER